MQHLLRTLCLFTLSTLATAAQTQTVFVTFNSTINFTVAEDVVVGYGSQEDLDNRVNGTSPILNITGGATLEGYATAFNSSQVNMSSGNVVRDLIASDTSTINLSGGSVDTSLLASDNSRVYITDGSVQSLFALENSIANVSGGSIASVYTNSRVNYTGGNVSNGLYASVNGVLHIYGTNLSSVLTNPNANGGSSSLYTLSGTLLDGTSVDGKEVYIQNQSNARFFLHNAVPAPSSVAVFLIGALPLGGLALRRRRK